MKTIQDLFVLISTFAENHEIKFQIITDYREIYISFYNEDATEDLKNKINLTYRTDSELQLAFWRIYNLKK